MGERQRQSVEKLRTQNRQRATRRITPCAHPVSLTTSPRRGVRNRRHHLRQRRLRHQRIIHIHHGHTRQLGHRRNLRAPRILQGHARTLPPTTRMQRHRIPAIRRLRHKHLSIDLRHRLGRHTLRKRDTRHAVIHRRPQHQHRRMRQPVRQPRIKRVGRHRVRRIIRPRRILRRRLIMGMNIRGKLL